jgi:esterase/lipase/1-acyl-sn-glycerol-3-phosphate acyltransferase
MANFAFTSTKWALRLASKLTKADVRLHNLEVIQDDMAIIFAVNHFTRLETLLLPYQFNKHTGLEVWSLAAAELFVGRLGEYLKKLGTVSTKDPDRDKMIVHSLLKGDHPWIIFPEGQMIKDKKVVGPTGTYQVYNSNGGRRTPHKGVANLALRAEFYRYKLECIYNNPNQEGLEETKDRFGIENDEEIESILKKRTVIIPVNITYYPIRARDNLLLRMASTFAKDLSTRSLEELSVEGTLLSGDTDIDITLGNPIDAQDYLHDPLYAELMACGDDLNKIEADPRSLFNEAASELMPRYMEDIYKRTRINYDHIFSTIVRYQGSRSFTERRYRNRIFLAVHQLIEEDHHDLHGLLKDTYRSIIYEDPSPKFNDFVKLCMEEGVLDKDGPTYKKVNRTKKEEIDFHHTRAYEMSKVIANEVEPLEGFSDLVRDVSKMSKHNLSETVRELFLEEDRNLFETDYHTFKSKDSRHMDIGRPFLMVPERFKAGIVLTHGYLAAPKEIKLLAQYLYDQGYVVYGVRLRGHGTSPEDLARIHWRDWYESLNRGYAIIKTFTDKIILGGFSTGGCLALMGAGLKREKIHAAFAINAPLRLKQFSARLAPSVAGMNALISRLKGSPTGWEYVQNEPENAHINYKRNPLAGVKQLYDTMESMEDQLGNIIAPTLIVQGSKDPTVDPTSGIDIFNQVGTPLKELVMIERENHGIVNGAGAEDVYEKVRQFLNWAQDQSPVITEEAPQEVMNNARFLIREPQAESA